MLSKNKRPYNPEDLSNRDRLRRNVGNIVATNSLSIMGRTMEVMRDVNAIDPFSFSDIVRLKQPRDMKKKFMKHMAWMPFYWAKIRCHDVKSNSERPRQRTNCRCHSVPEETASLFQTRQHTTKGR